MTDSLTELRPADLPHLRWSEADGPYLPRFRSAGFDVQPAQVLRRHLVSAAKGWIDVAAIVHAGSELVVYIGETPAASVPLDRYAHDAAWDMAKGYARARVFLGHVTAFAERRRSA